MAAFLDEVVNQFYDTCSSSSTQYQFGQFFRVPAYYPQRTLEVWRPKTIDRALGIASDFNIQTATDAFRRTSPLSAPHLKTNEEFIAIRGKPRPVLMTRPPDPALLREGQAGRIARHLCPVALVYSAEDEAGGPKFPTEFIDRVRRLEYPQFIFLPKGGPLASDSIARFDELQSVALQQLSPSGYTLAADALAIVRSQISYYLTGLAGQDFAGWAQLLREA